MTNRRKRDLAALTSALLLAVSLALLIWPIVSNADTPLEKAGRGLYFGSGDDRSGVASRH